MVDYDAKTWARIAAAISLVALVLFVPLPQSLVAPAYVQPTAQPVYANPGGRLTPIANYGSNVVAGELLATLHNPELQRTGQRLDARLSELQTQLESLTRNPLTANSELIPTIRESLKAATEQRQKFEVESAKLQIIAQADGVFQPPPAVAREERPDLPQFWNGTAINTENTGAWISRGTLLATSAQGVT